MRSLCVVPEEVRDQFLVKEHQIIPHESPVQCDELVVECTIESFDERIHLGTPRIRVVVNDSKLGTCVTEQKLELAAVVCLYFSDRYRRDLPEKCKEVSRGLRRVRSVPVGKGDAVLHIDRREYIRLHTIDESHHGIDLKSTLFSASELDPLGAAGFLDRFLTYESSLLAIRNTVADI